MNMDEYVSIDELKEGNLYIGFDISGLSIEPYDTSEEFTGPIDYNKNPFIYIENFRYDITFSYLKVIIDGKVGWIFVANNEWFKELK